MLTLVILGCVCIAAFVWAMCTPMSAPDERPALEGTQGVALTEIAPNKEGAVRTSLTDETLCAVVADDTRIEAGRTIEIVSGDPTRLMVRCATY